MNRDLTDHRKIYDKNVLIEENIPESPFRLFSDWFAEVETFGGVEETNAMSITTIGLDGFPKTRVVLLKHFDENGLVFYTNYESEKGRAIANHNKVCVSFFWPNLERQVIIKGVAEKISEEDSIVYFQSRPRGSQLGAWASLQSTEIKTRETLEETLKILDNKYKNSPIPKPPFWGGYSIKPIEFEFWQGRPNRLHDRIRYQNNDKNLWVTSRLSP